MHIWQKHSLGFVLLVICGAASGTEIVLSFDDVIDTGQATGSLINDGYSGFGWDNFGVIEPEGLGTPFTNSGYKTGLISGDAVGFAPGGPASVIRRTSSFSLLSGHSTGAWENGLRVLVSGFVGTTLVSRDQFFVTTHGPVFWQFSDFNDLDSVEIRTAPGVNAGLGRFGSQVAIDDLRINIPEPAAFALIVLGLAGFGFARHRQLTT